MTVPPPRPRTHDPLDAAFWDQCQDGVLRFQRCSRCAAWRFLPRYLCAQCGSPKFDWSAVDGEGSLYSWTVIHQAMHPAFADEVPYVAAVVELDEGVRMATRLLDCDRGRLRLGARVRVAFRQMDEGFQLPCFALAESESTSVGKGRATAEAGE